MIRIADIRVEWPRIKDRLAEICHSDRPEDVYAACKYGHATLLMCGDAFAVTYTETDQHSGIRQVRVWKISARGLMAQMGDEFYAMCKREDVARVVMGSKRSEWGSVSGWNEGETEFWRDL